MANDEYDVSYMRVFMTEFQEYSANKFCLVSFQRYLKPPFLSLAVSSTTTNKRPNANSLVKSSLSETPVSVNLTF